MTAGTGHRLLDAGEVIREMHRTGTGPFPARMPGHPHSPARPWASSTPWGNPPGHGRHGAGAPPPETSDLAPGFPPRPAATGGAVAPGGGWPLHSQLEFGPLPGAIPSARLHARLVVREWGLASLADPVELIVSELVTNALRASPGGGGYPPTGAPRPIGLRLGSDQRQVLVEVWDSNPAPPAVEPTSEESETGRGLLMVQAMSRRWGYYYPAVGALPSAAVKVVWALVGGGPG